MDESPKREAPEQSKTVRRRAEYVPPSIIYEGKVTIRAGSPPPGGVGPFGGSPSPFSPPGS